MLIGRAAADCDPLSFGTGAPMGSLRRVRRCPPFGALVGRLGAPTAWGRRRDTGVEEKASLETTRLAPWREPRTGDAAEGVGAVPRAGRGDTLAGRVGGGVGPTSSRNANRHARSWSNLMLITLPEGFRCRSTAPRVTSAPVGSGGKGQVAGHGSGGGGSG